MFQANAMEFRNLAEVYLQPEIKKKK